MHQFLPMTIGPAIHAFVL